MDANATGNIETKPNTKSPPTKIRTADTTSAVVAKTAPGNLVFGGTSKTPPKNLNQAKCDNQDSA